MGVISIQADERNGKVCGVVGVHDNDELMIMTSSGKIIRMAVGELRSIGRNTKGVRLVGLEGLEKVRDIERMIDSTVEEDKPAENKERAWSEDSGIDEELIKDEDIDESNPDDEILPE